MHGWKVFTAPIFLSMHVVGYGIYFEWCESCTRSKTRSKKI